MKNEQERENRPQDQKKDETRDKDKERRGDELKRSGATTRPENAAAYSPQTGKK